MNQYIPGVCNIGKRERLNRLRLGITTMVGTLILTIFFILNNVDIGIKYVLVVPAFSGFLGIYQYIFKFCAAFGILRKYNFGNSTESHNVVENEYIRKDIIKAVQIIVLSIVSAVIYTYIITLI